MSLSQKAITGILWNLGDQFARRGLSAVVTLILAYFLVPADFGLLAMMAVFINIASALMDSGFKQALIRLPEIRDVDFNTAFYANLVLGVVAYCLIYLSAPWIAEFYQESQLSVLIRVAALVVVINAFQVVQYVVLSRQLNFKRQFNAALPASVLSAVIAIVIAYLGYGVWALIAQMLSSALFITIFLWMKGPWQPERTFCLESLTQMYSFGYKLFLSTLLEVITNNMYVLVIAKLFSVGVAGLYFFAERIREVIIYQIISSIQKVTYPALSSIQMDSIRLKQGYRKLVTLTTFIIFPFVLFVAALSEPIFQFFLPEKWWPASIYLQLMCIATVMRPVHAINLNIIKVVGRSDILLFMQIIKKIMAVIILMLCYKFGVIGILLGQIVGSFLSYIPNSYYSKKLIDYPVKEQFLDFFPGLFLASFCSIGIWCLQTIIDWSPGVELVLFGAAGLFFYLFLSWLLNLSAFSMALGLVAARGGK